MEDLWSWPRVVPPDPAPSATADDPRVSGQVVPSAGRHRVRRADAAEVARLMGMTHCHAGHSTHVREFPIKPLPFAGQGEVRQSAGRAVAARDLESELNGLVRGELLRPKGRLRMIAEFHERVSQRRIPGIRAAHTCPQVSPHPGQALSRRFRDERVLEVDGLRQPALPEAHLVRLSNKEQDITHSSKC